MLISLLFLLGECKEKKEFKLFKIFFWNYFKNSIIKRSLFFAIKKKSFQKAFRIWFGLFSALAWGTKNKKLTIRHFI